MGGVNSRVPHLLEDLKARTIELCLRVVRERGLSTIKLRLGLLWQRRRWRRDLR